MFQSTRPVKGATCGHTSMTPHVCVSIHAPREGRDFPSLVEWPESTLMFQSTRPVKGATLFLIFSQAICRFQSTRPVKGATPAKFAVSARILVSIHAPREGRDERKLMHCRDLCWFQSTRPVKGATQTLEYLLLRLHGFNPRAP